MRHVRHYFDEHDFDSIKYTDVLITSHSHFDSSLLTYSYSLLHAGYAPRTIHLQGQLPEGKLRFKDKEFDAGMVSCGVPQTVIVQLKNDGTCESSFKVRVKASQRTLSQSLPVPLLLGVGLHRRNEVPVIQYILFIARHHVTAGSRPPHPTNQP